MKKSLKMILASLACLLVFAGCTNNQKPTEGQINSKTVPYSRGVLNEQSYESEFLNLKFTAPSNYIMMTQEELDQTLDLSSEEIFKDKDKKIIDYTKAVTVYEMQALCSDTMGNFPNLSIGVEKLNLKNITETQYLDVVKGQLQEVTQIDYTLEDDYSKMTVAGQEYTTLVATTSIGGINLKQSYLVRKINDRMAFIILTENTDESQAAQDLLNCLQPLV